MEDTRLDCSASTGERPPRETIRDFDAAHQAVQEFDRTRGQKMREGFVRVADAAEAARGGVVLDAEVPHRCSATLGSLSADGGTLVVGTMLKDAYGAGRRSI